MSFQNIDQVLNSNPFAVAVLRSDGKFINKSNFLKDFLKTHFEEESAKTMGYRTIYSGNKDKNNDRELDSENFEGKAVGLFSSNKFHSANDNNDEGRSPNNEAKKSPVKRKSLVEITKPKKKKKTKISKVRLTKPTIVDETQIRMSRKLINPSDYFNTLKENIKYCLSNCTTIRQFLDGQSFQTVAYQQQYSEEFFQSMKQVEESKLDATLVDNKRLLFSFDYLGHTAYHWAVKIGRPDLLKILLFYGKHANQKDMVGRTPLHYAALNNDRECCNVLIQNLGDPHSIDNDGKKPVDLATDQIVKVMLNDAESNIKCISIFKRSETNKPHKETEEIENKKE